MNPVPLDKSRVLYLFSRNPMRYAARMVTTLGEAWQQGWTLWVRCAAGKIAGMKRIRECTMRAELDLATLLWTRGRNFPLARLESRMMCPRCGSREVVIAFVPPGAGARQPAAE